jgi:hypothetical protein
VVVLGTGDGQSGHAHVHLPIYRGAIVYHVQVEIARLTSTNLETLLAVG